MSQSYKLGKLARQRSDGSRYWDIVIKWRDQDGPHRVSLGTTCRVTAETKARRFWEARTLARADSVGAIVQAYLDSTEGQRSHKRNVNSWKQIRPFWGHLTLADVDVETSRTLFPAWRQRAANTMRNELGLIRVALHWARDEKKLVPMVPKIVLMAQPPSKVGHLSKPQFRQFLKGCVMPHVTLYAMLSVSCGGRKGAVLDAKWTFLDFDRCQLDLLGDADAVANKGRATVPLGDRIMRKLREAHEGRLTEYIIEYGGSRIQDIKKGVAAAAKRAKLSHVTPHMFRHSAAVWMAEDRVPMSEIAAFLGHKDSRITERVYAKYHPDYLRKASKSLDW